MENGFDRLTAKEARQQRVTRSLRSMETEANELVAFLDEQRDRRRTINIMVRSGQWISSFNPTASNLALSEQIIDSKF